MRNFTIALWVLGLLGSVGMSTVQARSQVSALATDQAPTEAERDLLIDKIARGVDYDASVARFKALYEQRQSSKDAALREVEAKRLADQQEREQAVLRERSLDHRVAQSCALSVDPKSPPPGFYADSATGDWGKVTRKETQTIKGRTAFDDDQTVYLYTVEGRAKTYALSTKHVQQLDGTPLIAKVGDLVLVCYRSLMQEGHDGSFPAGFRGQPVGSGMVAKLAALPLVTRKGRWNPLFLDDSRIRMAIDQVEWRYPAGQPVLSYVKVDRELESGRFAMLADRREFVLEVPPSLKNRELLKPRALVWLIMSDPRFDKSIKKLVLRAEDIEAHYVEQAP